MTRQQGHGGPLWDHGDLSAKELADRLKGAGGLEQNYHLYRDQSALTKGGLRSEPGFVCHPWSAEEEVREQETDALIDRMYGGSADLLVANLLGTAGSPRRNCPPQRRIEELVIVMLSLLELSLTGGVFILAVVVVRALAMNRLPRQAFLLLWAMALACLLLPFSIPSPTSLYSAAGHLGEGFRRAGIVTAGGTMRQGRSGRRRSSLDGPALGRGRWPVPCASCSPTCGAAGSGMPLCRWRTPLSPPGWPAIPSAGGYGCAAPTGWIAPHLRSAPPRHPPAQNAGPWSDVSRLAFVLTHEMAHIRRFDALSKLLLAVAACLHWFNPLVWVMLVLANRDLELSCDAAVVRLYGAEARAPYARTLLELEARRSRFLPCAPLSTKTPWRSASAPSCAPAKPPPRRWP